MDHAKDPWANENSLPIREIDGPFTHGEAKDADVDIDSPAPSDPVVRSIVPAPRPFAYRQPLGTPESAEEPHPRRRQTD